METKISKDFNSENDFLGDIRLYRHIHGLDALKSYNEARKALLESKGKINGKHSRGVYEQYGN